MSLDSEASPPDLSRDWFFTATSPYLPHAASGAINRTLNPRRKPSAFPATDRAPKPYLREARSQQRFPPSAETSNSTSPATSISRGDPRYAGLRRKVRFDTREEKEERKGSLAPVEVSAESPIVARASGGRRRRFWGRLVDRWMRVRLFVAVSIAEKAEEKLI